MDIVFWPYEDSTGECDMCGHMVTEVGRTSSDVTPIESEVYWCGKCGQLYVKPVDAPEEDPA